MALKRTAAQVDLARAAAKRFCSRQECGNVALAWHQLCEACYEAVRSAEVKASLEARGLKSVEDCKAYCRRMAKKVLHGAPSFERWAESMTQATVDVIVTMRTPSDVRLLERLRSIGVIDEKDKLVPLAERAARRGAIEALEKERRAAADAQIAAAGIVPSEWK